VKVKSAWAKLALVSEVASGFCAVLLAYARFVLFEPNHLLHLLYFLIGFFLLVLWLVAFLYDLLE